MGGNGVGGVGDDLDVDHERKGLAMSAEAGERSQESGVREELRESKAMQQVLRDSEALQMACLKYRRAVYGAGVDPLWRWFAISGWILVMILAAVAARGSVVTGEFLDAMECIESGMDARAVGDQGRSRGSFQFHAAAWQMVNNWRAIELKPAVPYSVGAHCRRTARQFAFEYLRWLESHLAAALRRSPSRPELYAAWNLGPSGFRARGFLLQRCPAGTRDAAGRLENLAGWLEQKAAKAAKGA
jgi:hypothetical protein